MAGETGKTTEYEEDATTRPGNCNACAPNLSERSQLRVISCLLFSAPSLISCHVMYNSIAVVGLSVRLLPPARVDSIHWTRRANKVNSSCISQPPTPLFPSLHNKSHVKGLARTQTLEIPWISPFIDPRGSTRLETESTLMALCPEVCPKRSKYSSPSCIYSNDDAKSPESRRPRGPRQRTTLSNFIADRSNVSPC